jgi:hypothetical protein
MNTNSSTPILQSTENVMDVCTRKLNDNQLVSIIKMLNAKGASTILENPEIRNTEIFKKYLCTNALVVENFKTKFVYDIIDEYAKEIKNNPDYIMSIFGYMSYMFNLYTDKDGSIHGYGSTFLEPDDFYRSSRTKTFEHEFVFIFYDFLTDIYFSNLEQIRDNWIRKLKSNLINICVKYNTKNIKEQLDFLFRFFKNLLAKVLASLVKKGPAFAKNIKKIVQELNSDKINSSMFDIIEMFKIQNYLKQKLSIINQLPSFNITRTYLDELVAIGNTNFSYSEYTDSAYSRSSYLVDTSSLSSNTAVTVSETKEVIEPSLQETETIKVTKSGDGKVTITDEVIVTEPSSQIKTKSVIKEDISAPNISPLSADAPSVIIEESSIPNVSSVSSDSPGIIIEEESVRTVGDIQSEVNQLITAANNTASQIDNGSELAKSIAECVGLNVSDLVNDR